MIIEFFLDIICDLLVGGFHGAAFVSIPHEAIFVLATFTGYGNYIVGSDLLLVFCGVIAFWMTIKLFVGLVLFVWRLIPFT